MAKTNMDAVLAAREQIDKDGGKTPVIKWEEGQYRLRLVPAPEGYDLPWQEILVAFGVGPNKKTLVPRRQFGLDPDPFMDYVDALAKRKDKASQEELKQVNPKRRFKMIVRDRDDPTSPPKLMDLNIMVMKDLLKFFADPEFGDLADPEEGRDLKITYIPKEKSKTKKFPEWELIVSPRITPLKNPDEDDEEYEAMLAANYFEEYRIGFPNTAEYMQAVLDGEDEEFKGNRATLPNGEPIQRPGDEKDEDEEAAAIAAAEAAEEAAAKAKAAAKAAAAKKAAPATKKTAPKPAPEPEPEVEVDADTDGEIDEDGNLVDEDAEAEDEAVQAAVTKAAPKPAGKVSAADAIKAKLKAASGKK